MVFVLSGKAQIQIEQLYEGQYINQTIYQGNYNGGGCYPAIYDVKVYANEIIPFATGIQLYMVFTDVSLNSGILLADNQQISTGDTLYFSGNDSIYDMIFTGGGNYSYNLVIEGTPEIANEIYPCWVGINFTLANCGNGNSFYVGESLIPCSVVMSIGISENELLQNLFFSEENQTLIVETEIENELIVTDVLGKIILNEELKKGKHSITIPQVSKGVYIATIKSSNSSLKFVVN